MNNTTSSTSIHVHIPSLRLLIALVCLTLYLLGYTGCLLSIVTFSSKKLRRHSTGFLFLVMAFVDILNLFASLQYFLEVIYQINVYQISIHWCRFFTIVNYELYFGFSWIFVFISVDRWIKVEWPTRSQTLCTRKRLIYLCLSALIVSLLQNTIYTFLCFTSRCEHKNLICEIFIHVIYITIYMIIPIVLILTSISRTCLITLHVKRRFHTTTTQRLVSICTPQLVSSENTLRVDAITNTLQPVPIRISNSFLNTPSTTTTITTTSASNSTTNHHQIVDYQNRLANYSGYLRRRRSRLDTQMVILISINVAPFILVHIITEIAYLFEKYSSFVAQSKVTQLLIVLIYLSWYFISATRFYTNCLLSRIYREEFKTRLSMFRFGCQPRVVLVDSNQSRRLHRGSLISGVESKFISTVPRGSFVTT